MTDARRNFKFYPEKIMLISSLQKSTVVILAVLVLSCPARMSLADNKIVSLIENNLKKTVAFSGSFTQEYFDVFQNKTKRSKGKFYFRSPGLIKWIYQSPDELEIIVGKDKIWVYDPVLENVIIRTIKSGGAMNPLLFLFRYGKLNNYFKETQPKHKFLDAKPGLGTVFLAPLKKNHDISEVQIAFNKEAGHIRQFAVKDHSGNHRKITFLNLNYQDKPGLKEFEFKPPQGVEIIQDLEDARKDAPF